MDVSGGSGQPRPGNDESAEPQAGPTAPATGSARPEPAESGPPGERPADGPRTAEEAHGDPARTATDPTGDRSPTTGADDPPATPSANTPAPGTPDPATPASGPHAQDAGPESSGPEPSGADAPGPEPSPRSAGSAPESAGAGTPARGATTPETPARETPLRKASSPGAQGETPEGAAPAHGEPEGKTPDDAAPERTPDPNPAPDPRTSQPPAHAPAHHGHGDRDTHPGHPRADSHPGRTPAQHPRANAHGDGGTGPARPPQRKPEPGGGLLMGRPFGVPVYVAPSWFLVAALITWVFGGQLDRVLPELGAARYLVSLFFAVAFYASVLVHELAHTVAALRFKLPVRRIQLQFFGGVSEIEKEAETPGREFVLAFVGPLLSLVLAGVFYAALLPVEPDSVPGVLLAGLMISNLLVAAFNLLPGLPLDGGRMLRAVVWKITGKPMNGTIAAAWVGRALAIAVLIGLPLLTQSLGSGAADDVGMDTVMDALLAAILAAIIWTGAGNSLRMARLREHLPELRARALTRRAVPVPADTPLSEALRRANASGARALVVVDADGAPVSLVREAAIVGVPEHRRPWVAVSTLAQDLTDGMRVSAELSGEELLDALRANPATEYLVVEETGEIYGVLSAADVERAFVKAMARPS
ncbi:site-2 protease family protein [Streptomyces sp. AC602_WCS936]|uniref:site-2 protease family protein n=1 Tax=Streptomyces sp. AC602_WCS936 TaxID=2823685 RepID=UPI001C252D69|nr:site-2 protease family protein [Streptomyces sp. AC602_WCS936]